MIALHNIILVITSLLQFLHNGADMVIPIKWKLIDPYLTNGGLLELGLWHIVGRGQFIINNDLKGGGYSMDSRFIIYYFIWDIILYYDFKVKVIKTTDNFILIYYT